MGDNLVIVESPAKAKTIEKFLGEGFTVKSSFGHIRDLKKTGLGIDLTDGFAPQYEIPADKKKVVSELQAEANKASMVWLASDEDREGEAIAWHLYDVLGLRPDRTRRIVFHEITKNAILDAIKNPRDIDMDLVMAQQARRVLDRLVGFELSPVLWKKVQRGLSAGRVQSVALRLIVDREREISSFSVDKYYRVEAVFVPEGGGQSVKAVLNSRFENEAQARSFIEKCRSAHFVISDIVKKQGSRTPAAPFTTSSLQQEAARKLGFSVSQTMSVAQTLYESGLITYMRTDSTNLSSLAVNTAKETITQLYGDKYSKVRSYHTKVKGAQEAHEAIRPTYMANQKIDGTPAEKRLYDLIWKRTVACQMADAQIEKTTVEIEGDTFSEKFVAEGEVVVFDGFLKVYAEGRDDEVDEETAVLPSMKVGGSLLYSEVQASEKYTQKPPRYSEASLVKKLEELGIGRPSTYAPTITTIIKRGYIVKGDKDGEVRSVCRLRLENGNVTRTVIEERFGAEKKKLLPENIGIVVTDFLVSKFEDILDYGFTANVENDFDKVADGGMVWNSLIDSFYHPFHRQVEKSLEDTAHNNAERIIGTDPVSGKTIIARIGPYGPMVQRGENDDPQRQFASMRPGQLIENISLEEALDLLKLPRLLGKYQDKDVFASVGRFGPYVKFDGKFVSIPKPGSPFSITLEEAVGLIEQKRQQELNRNINEFPDVDIHVLNGRYGPYIKQGEVNYKIPKGTEVSSLTKEDCLAIIEAAKASPAPAKRKFVRKSAKK